MSNIVDWGGGDGDGELLGGMWVVWEVYFYNDMVITKKVGGQCSVLLSLRRFKLTSAAALDNSLITRLENN